jgi:hypothetical protein
VGEAAGAAATERQTHLHSSTILWTSMPKKGQPRLRESWLALGPPAKAGGLFYRVGVGRSTAAP